MSRARSVVLTVGAVVGSLCLLVALAGALFGVKPLVFKSGSMSPTIPAGALALSRPVDAPEVKVGDIVSTFTSNTAGHVRVTHRVYAVSGRGESRRLTLKGDANPTPDAQPYTVTRVDRVFWSVAWVGRVIVFFGSPIGLMVLGALVVIVLYVGFRRPRGGGGAHSSSGAGPNTDTTKGGKRHALAVVAPALALAVAVPSASGTWAAFSDSSTVTSGTLTAYSVPAPVLSCANTSSGGILGLGKTYTATISWPAVSSPYALEYNASIGGTDVTDQITTANDTKSLAVTSSLLSDLLGNLLGDNETVQITATLPRTTWSAAKRWDLKTGLLGTGPACTGSSY